MQPNRIGQIHVLGTHETLSKYMHMNQVCDVKQSDWFKSTSHKAAGKQLEQLLGFW